MTDIVEKAIQSVNSGQLSFCRFIVANDTGSTGSHQSGYYIPKRASKLFFETPGKKGSNIDRQIRIKWQGDFETENRAIYYGTGTRNEYRLTRFGQKFPFLDDEYAGSLLIISKTDQDYFDAYVLNNESDIEDFLEAFGMSPADTGGIIEPGKLRYEDNELEVLVNDFVESLNKHFPDTITISDKTREICNRVLSINKDVIIKNPDETILKWLNAEFGLFRKIEETIYSSQLTGHFNSVDEFIQTANTILNRRKSRAGKSLENHLSAIFDDTSLKYDKQAATEGNKKPDFIFPGSVEYQNSLFDSNGLVFLAAKTTCKDRWRQILNEADRIKTKHLFTLQQGISQNQLDEMYESGVVLVVPEPYRTSFPVQYRDKIFSLKSFVCIVQSTQNK